MKEGEKGRIFIRYSPSFGIVGHKAYETFKKWEEQVPDVNLEYLYGEDGSFIVQEIDKTQLRERIKRAK